MRQLYAWVPAEGGAAICTRATEAGASHVLRLPAGAGPEDAPGPDELVVLHMPNDRFDAVLEALEPVDGLRLAFQRDSTILLEPPPERLGDQVSDVSMRGPLEILVEGLQSLGGMATSLTLSAVAGAIAWAGLVTDTIFLLTAAMLIAPYAAPAMAAALATARGDAALLQRSLGRYVTSLATSAVTAALLTLVWGIDEMTHLMVEVANVSGASLVLPVAAGVAGALSFARPDRTSLSPGAGIGMLVALALAPQAALLGISLVLGEARIAGSAAFLATLQLLGINLAATLVFRRLGIGVRIPRASQGRRAVGVVAFAVTAAAALAMVGLQWGVHPDLTRETIATRAEAAVMAALDEHPDVLAVDATARFPFDEDLPATALAVEGRAVPRDGRSVDATALAAQLRERLARDHPDLDLHVGVTVGAGG